MHTVRVAWSCKECGTRGFVELHRDDNVEIAWRLIQAAHLSMSGECHDRHRGVMLLEFVMRQVT